MEGLYTEGYLRFKIDWASSIVESKCTVLALFYFVFEGNFPSTSPRGAYIWRGDLTEGFYALPDWGLIFIFRLIHGGAYFRNFTVSQVMMKRRCRASQLGRFTLLHNGR